jgi:uncharacterized protein (DUF362 family)
MTIADWQRADTVVLYRSPAAYPYSDDDFAKAARTVFDALEVAIDKPSVVLKPNVVHGVAPDSGITVHPAFLRSWAWWRASAI